MRIKLITIIIQAEGVLKSVPTASRLKLLGLLATLHESITTIELLATCTSVQVQDDLPRGDIYDVDLELLEHMPNLTELCLCRQGIRDVSALEALPLATLILCADPRARHGEEDNPSSERVRAWSNRSTPAP